MRGVYRGDGIWTSLFDVGGCRSEDGDAELMAYRVELALLLIDTIQSCNACIDVTGDEKGGRTQSPVHALLLHYRLPLGIDRLFLFPTLDGHQLSILELAIFSI